VERAEAARVSFKNALALFPPTESGWKPYAETCSAIEGNGIRRVWKMVEDYISFTRENGYLDHLRTQQAKYWMYETINQNLLDSFYKSDKMEQLITQTEQRVLNNEISSFTAAYDLLKEYGNNKQ
jgi:LAO/AO transport system kinase